MAALIFQKEEFLLSWAAERIETVGTAAAFGPALAVGVMTNPTPAGRLMAAVVFHTWVPQYETCQASIAAIDPRWALPGTVRKILAVPFLVGIVPVGETRPQPVNRVWAAVPHTASRTEALLKRLGFTREGALRHHLGPGIHAIIMGMLRAEYVATYGGKDGEELAGAA